MLARSQRRTVYALNAGIAEHINEQRSVQGHHLLLASHSKIETRRTLSDVGIDARIHTSSGVTSKGGETQKGARCNGG